MKRERRPERLRVLVVEDETLIALHLESLLEELGHTVVGIAARVDQALELAGREAVDLAILDVNLDGQQSYPVADALAAHHVPFMFATGYDATRLQAPYGDNLVLTKPYTSRDLQEAIAGIFVPSPGRRRPAAS